MDLPELATSEQALLHRFRDGESPSDAVVRRIEARLASRIDAGDDPRPLAPVLPFSHIGKAAVIALALAAAVLLVLGGSTRLVQAVRRSATPEQASDVRTGAAPSGEAHAVAPAPTAAAPAPEVAAPLIVPPPPTAAPAIDLAAVPGALDARRDAVPRAKPPTEPVTAVPAPADAAAEIAFLFSAKREAEPERRLAKLSEHATKFPKGALGEEFAVLEIQTLCELGRTDRAAEQSAGFLRAHPDSAFAAIARRGCAREDGRR